ncbi:MAG: glycoside-pentoside-hexuronide (GPH):cation symporter [Clostridiales bacterium]|nr:glycoside-pentoside-hexuronide (GPH):cation symporter [Roseburia sp.]MDD7635793.1 glycoside-pentoside-hexuronide (GPH):cation symporter [Clostridiales bacterium]MDY4112124.1 glycoside-pentoside-hexuronide (GPH):cation symporter [Roseburia sp.]
MAKTLSKKNIIGYALGDTGGVLSFGVVSSFLQMYYTDVLHISLPKITILMLVARIWDAINDPLCGAFIDSRKPTKYGRFRPYVFWFSFPMIVAFVLIFVKIPGLSESQYLIYAYITYILYGMMYTGVNIPYGSMASAMTDDQRERSTLSVARSFGSGVGSLPGQILLPLFVYSTAVDTGVKYLDGNKLLGGIILIAGFMVIIYIASFKMTRENIAPPASQKKEGMGKVMRSLMHNRPFVTLCLASLLLIAGSMYTQTVFNYLFKNYFGKPGLFAMVTVATYIPMLLLMPLMGKLMMRFGKKELCSFGSIFAAAAFLLLYLIRTDNPYVFLGLVLLSGFGVSFFTLEVWALVSDTIDYQEKLTNRRDEGTSYACFSFFRKLGQTLAGMGASIALAAIGYVTAEGVTEQSMAVNEGIYNIATIVPFVMYLVMFLLLQFGYPLTKGHMEELKTELAVQREKNQV